MKKESKLKKKINELKKTNKGKAILKLIKWFIFFAILLIILIISSFIKQPVENKVNNNLNNNQVVEEYLSQDTFNKIKNTLLNSTYNYNYEISINDQKYIFNGNKNKEYEAGYKETSMGVIKYYVDASGIYEEKLNEKIPLTNLYENLDINYLNLENLLNILNDKDFILKENNLDLKYEYNTDNIIYEIIISKDNIIKAINISNIDYNYNLVFNNIEV